MRRPVVVPTADEAAARLADLAIDALAGACASGGRVDAAIAGGFVCERVLPAMRARANEVEWSRVRVWWVDERFVAADDPDRNDLAAIASFFDEVPGARLMRMPADRSQGLDEAVREFGGTWAREMAGRRLDLVVAGMGPDGHVASLFPGFPWSMESGPDVVAVRRSPKPPPNRISLSMPVLTSARRILLGACGSSKARALSRAYGGAHPQECPAAALLDAGAEAVLDAQAARELLTVAERGNERPS
ncbi:6-phosphogluconolactonase [Actinomyces sp. B33]|uniref:6-phosphogluconolactonase n=1 Tax=Actinomyces sp. B33 TaxID=2942131 RepID=UPI002341E321|nr:6-phosphogluconolactonase [Actinomyces sp. B33]MDC4233286.1 6-phosphogluconolactonase [Actinomyces sp. B33]